MNCKKNKKYFLVILIILVIISFCSILLLCNYKKKYKESKTNEYNMAFYELLGNTEKIENYLLKSTISHDSLQEAETLMYVWRASNLSQIYLSELPIENEGISNTQKFLNQVSDYSYSLIKKNLNKQNLSQEELNKLNDLYNYCKETNSTLNQIFNEMNSNTLNWKELEQTGSSMFDKELSNYSKDSFNSIENNFEQYDGLIYDGAYSEHITNVEKKGLTGDEIDENKAKEIVESFITNTEIKEIKSQGLSENGTIQSYTFEITNNVNDTIVISVTKKGGHILFMNYNRNIGDEHISVEDADIKALAYLEEKGYSHMKKTYYIKKEGIITINYAYEENGVIMYPDLIKVKVALDNGDILGIESTGYLNNHSTRNIDTTNIITSENAMKMLNSNLTAEYFRLAVIPTEFKTEIFCWEIKGKIEEKEFLLYVNAKTGQVEDILIVLDTGNGILTQ